MSIPHSPNQRSNPAGTLPPAQSAEMFSFSNAEQMILASRSIALLCYGKSGLRNLPAALKPVEEEAVPGWLRRSVPDETALAKLPETERLVGESDSRAVFDRLSGAWTYWGWKHGYFDEEGDARAFYDELRYMLATQKAAPNSPQWFNTGLHWAYGIDGPSQGHYYVDPADGVLTRSDSAYEHPQPHACFIQSVSDDLVNEGGIMDLWVREARLFKYGSGTGSNFSAIRGEGERLAGGGKSSGLMSFLKIGDRAAGAIKSGGTTRRAAKMVVVDVDHPDIEEYVDWKVREEQKVASLVTGSKIVKQHLTAVMKACVNCEGSGDDCFDPEKNPALKREIKAARKAHVPENYVRRIIQFARQGYTSVEFPVFDTDWDSEAYLTVAGQNSNNSVRVTDGFLSAVERDADWNLSYRTTGVVAKTLSARDLWERIGHAAWACADPGIQFHTTINDWHTCPAGGEIRASNPCSEYMFLDDTACNLASLNLLQFRNADGTFDVEAFEHAVKLWTMVLEISVTMAQFPSPAIAQNSYDYRTLGLGFANIGGLLMVSGIPYDSQKGRAICAAITATMTGVSYATSAEIARDLGAFPRYAENADAMLRVIRNHRRAAHGETGGYLRYSRERRNWFETDFPDFLEKAGKPLETYKRSSEHASYILEAIETGRTYRGHFNLPNGGTITTHHNHDEPSRREDGAACPPPGRPAGVQARPRLRLHVRHPHHDRLGLGQGPRDGHEPPDLRHRRLSPHRLFPHLPTDHQIGGHGVGEGQDPEQRSVDRAD